MLSHGLYRSVPREPADSTRTITGSARTGSGSADSTLHWYESRLGWAAVAGPPVRLLTGLRFDVLDLPSDAGFALLRRTPVTGPVALEGSRVRLLVAAGSADELPGLLDWLEWGGIALDLTAMGAGGLIGAPVPPGLRGAQGAARWLRPPGRGAMWSRPCPCSAGSGSGAALPTWYGSWKRRRRNATGPGWCVSLRLSGGAPGARTAVVRGANPGPPGNQPLAFS